MLRLKKVRSKVSDAPSTISIPHPQPSESAFKHPQYSQKTRFLLLFENSKKYSKTTVMWKLLVFFSDIAAPVRLMELRKHFHRLIHICSIRSQWYFFHNIFSYIRIIHRNPWNSCFQCRHKTFVLGLFSISIQGSRFGFSSYPSIFKTKLKKRSAPNFSQLVRRRHLKMGTWGKRTRKGSFQFKPSEKLCST